MLALGLGSKSSLENDMASGKIATVEEFSEFYPFRFNGGDVNSIVDPKYPGSVPRKRGVDNGRRRTVFALRDIAMRRPVEDRDWLGLIFNEE